MMGRGVWGGGVEGLGQRGRGVMGIGLAGVRCGLLTRASLSSQCAACSTGLGSLGSRPLGSRPLLTLRGGEAAVRPSCSGSPLVEAAAPLCSANCSTPSAASASTEGLDRCRLWAGVPCAGVPWAGVPWADVPAGEVAGTTDASTASSRRQSLHELICPPTKPAEVADVTGRHELSPAAVPPCAV